MALPFDVRGDPGDQFAQGTDKLHALGTIMYFADGRKFRYCLAGELLLIGESLQTPVHTANLDAACAAGSLGDQFISFTSDNTAAKDFYAEGYIYMSIPGSTNCRMYQIDTHALLTSSSGDLIYLKDDAGTQEAVVGDEEVSLTPNPFSNVVSFATGNTAGFAGIAVEDIASASYGWIQTGGIAVARCTTAVVETVALTPVSAAVSELDVVGADVEPIVGYCVRGASGTDAIEVSLVFLTVD